MRRIKTNEEPSIAGFPARLLTAVCGDDPPEKETLHQVVHRCGRFADIACAMAAAELSEREEEVLFYRFAMNETYETVGERYCVTRERIRQVEAKALRKLKWGASLSILKYGMEQYVNDQIEEIRSQTRMEAQMEIERFRQTSTGKAADADCQSSAMSTPIDELDLSVRGYNCLMRRSIKTVGDLLSFVQTNGEGWYRSVRNLGRRTADEIGDAIRRMYGIDLDAVPTMRDDELAQAISRRTSA